MLGLVDFVRAVYGTARLALRRIHPLAGPVVFGLVWVLALGSLLVVTRPDDGSSGSDDAAESTEREGDGTRSIDRDDGGSDGSGGSDGADGSGVGADGIGEAEWTDGGDSSPDGSNAAGDDDTADGSTLESAGGSGRVTPPSSTGSPPSRVEPEEPEEPGAPGEPGTTTSTTTPSTSGPTTSTTAPPAGGGGLLEVLLGVLFP